MNGFEAKVAEHLTSRGFQVLRRGWPDFLVLSREWDRGFAVEAKAKGDRLSEDQKVMHMALARFGIVTLVAKDDFTENCKKRGRKLLLPSDLSMMRESLSLRQQELNSLLSRAEALREELASHRECIKYAESLFEESPAIESRQEGRGYSPEIAALLNLEANSA